MHIDARTEKAAGRLWFVSECLPANHRHWTYSLSTTQVYDDFCFAVILFKKLTNDLLNRVHTQPVPAIDEWISTHELWRKWLIVVRLITQIQLRYTSLGDNAAVIGLFLVLVECSWFVLAGPMDWILTFITSSSLFSLLDRTLSFRFAVAFLGFIFEVADIVAKWHDQNKPEVVIDFRQEQAGLG